MANLDIKIEVNNKKVQAKVESLLDDNTRIAIHNLFAKTINPYVPMDEGVLSQTLEITKDYVRYNVPYAHYQYIGEIYGPNIPKRGEGGIIEGWWSPPGQKKKPTGRPINYSKEKHPLATKEWDKVAMQTELSKFEEQVKELLKRRAKQLYG